MKKRNFMLTILTLCICIIGLGTVNAKADTDNLLINGSGEEEMTGWIDVDDCWFPDTDDTRHSAVDGETFFWPSKKETEFTQIYQDVDISDFSAGQNLELSAYLANYDQSPHDQATLKLDILDKSGNVLASDFSLQRNPEWCYHEINVKIPANAVTARVYLIAKRYVGLDDDAYFDAVCLKCTDVVSSPVIISGDKDKAQPGDKVQLSVTDGKYKKASYYEWYTSYDDIATVDENGLVTFKENPDKQLVGAELVVYAKSKKTGIIGKYAFNSDYVNPMLPEITQEPVSGGQDTSGSKPADVKVLNVVSVKLTWEQAKNATGYQIYKYNEATGKYKKIKTIKKATTLSYTATGLETGNTYKFKIRSYKTKNGKTTYSAYSPVVTVDLK